MTNKASRIPTNQITRFQTKILQFYRKNKRNLPWRNTTEPYKILLSEIMLQQTQVNRVIKYYQTWTEKWPTIQDLAQADRKEILSAWMGLGYNSRAVNLHKTAQIISTEYQGDILTALQHYKELPGIGPYTAQAVQIFATNKDLVTVDTNIRRILIYEFNLQENIKYNELNTLAQRLLPNGRSRDWHNALMDYGATLLTARKTGIQPQTKQSRFQGSDRQYRARILRLVLEKPRTVDQLHQQLPISLKRLTTILEKLEKEQILHKKDRIYYISETS